MMSSHDIRIRLLRSSAREQDRNDDESGDPRSGIFGDRCADSFPKRWRASTINVEEQDFPYDMHQACGRKQPFHDKVLLCTGMVFPSIV